MTPGLAKAGRRRDAALTGLEPRCGELVRQACQALLLGLLERGAATIDAVRRRVPLSAEASAKARGAVPRVLVKLGPIELDGYERTTRPEAHARTVQRWRLRDRAAALAWLRTHGPPEKEAAPGASTPDAAGSETAATLEYTTHPAAAGPPGLLFPVAETRPCRWNS